MNYKILILIGMVFCHIVDDYYLQGFLASAKQKEWWVKNYPDSLYRYDYIAALFMHSFSWTTSIFVLPALYNLFLNRESSLMIFVGVFISNILIHMFVDNLKANKKKINLLQDQIIHIIQVIITWILFVF